MAATTSHGREVNETTDNSLRKAAVFVRTLAPEAAVALLSRLSTEEASRLRAAIAALGDVDAGERSSVAHEALGRSTKRLEVRTSGVELLLGGDHAETLISQREAPRRPDPQQPAAPSDWFTALSDADAEAVAAYLRNEQPRAVALVLSQVAPSLGAAVLGRFSDEEQATILDQLATLGDADPSTVNVIASGLAEWVRAQHVARRRKGDRLASVQAILAAVPDEQRERLARELSKTHAGMVAPEPPATETRGALEPVADGPSDVEAVEPAPIAGHPTLAYDELERLDGRAIAMALGALDPRTAVLSLTAASDGLMARVESRLTRRAVRELRRRIMTLHQTSLDEIDRAQHALAAAASQIVHHRHAARFPSRSPAA
ncbi:MAG: FliG C-terminal domain-containing protein [Lacipirellulaceae bacterium]